MKYLYTVFLALLLGVPVFSQHVMLESKEELQTRLKTLSDTDTSKVRILCALAFKAVFDTTNTSINYAEQALELSETQKNKVGRVQAYCQLIRAYTIKRKYNEGSKYEKEGLALLPKIKDTYWKSEFFSALYRLYEYHPDKRDKAVKYALRAISMLDTADKQYHVLKIHHCNNIGEFFRVSNTPKSIVYLQKSLEVARLLPQPSVSLARAYNRLGACQFQLNLHRNGMALLDTTEERLAYKKALKEPFATFQKSLKVCNQLLKKIPDHSKLLDVYGNTLNEISHVYEYWKQQDSALYYNKKSIDVRKKLGDPSVIESYFNLSQLLRHTGKPEQALVLLKSLGKKLLETEKGNLVLAKVYRDLKKHEKAAYHWEQSYILADKEFTEKAARTSSELLAKYETDLKDKEIKITKAKSEAQAKEIKQKNTLNILFALGALLMLLFAVYFVYVNRQTKKTNQLLSNQKEEIETQAEELQAINDQLTELGQFKTDMSSMIVHDLKNPLNTVIGLTSGNLVNQQQQETVHQAGNQMHHLVMNMLDVHRLEESELIPELKDCSTVNLLHEAIAQVSFLAGQKGINILSPMVRAKWAKADENLIVRVLVNILNNAIKYSPANASIRIETSIHQANEGFVEIRITDEGMGISAEKQQQVFEKFKGDKGKSREGSTGLGLTFAALAVRAHHGKIWLESTEGKGTTFFFILPAGTETDEMIAGLHDLAEIEALPLAPGKLTEIPEMQTCIAQLRQADIYEATKIFEALQSISHLDNHEVLAWKEQVEKAVYAYNEDKYEELVGA